MSSNVEQGIQGYAYLKKISGSGALSANAEIQIPYQLGGIYDPSNDSYELAANKSSALTLLTRGMKTPYGAISAKAKQSWLTTNWLKSLFITEDSYRDTDLLAMMVVSDVETTKMDGVRGKALTLAYDARGGGIMAEIALMGTTASGSTSFSGTGSTDAGELIGPHGVDYGGSATADLVQGWRLSLDRNTQYDFFSNRTRQPAAVSSGPLTGTLTLLQSMRAATIPSTTITIRVYYGAVGSQTLLTTITCYLNLDIAVKQKTVGLNMISSQYTLIDSSSGGVPVGFA